MKAWVAEEPPAPPPPALGHLAHDTEQSVVVVVVAAATAAAAAAQGVAALFAVRGFGFLGGLGFLRQLLAVEDHRPGHKNSSKKMTSRWMF